MKAQYKMSIVIVLTCIGILSLYIIPRNIRDDEKVELIAAGIIGIAVLVSVIFSFRKKTKRGQ